MIDSWLKELNWGLLFVGGGTLDGFYLGSGIGSF